jgi:2-oxoglutarate ferredoxin oxidoreductase subunit delta
MQVQAGSITLYLDRCKRCGVCIELCPSQVYTSTSEGYPEITKIEKCTNCGLCELWCPDYAIEVRVKDDDQSKNNTNEGK